jgi:hypothetical protein
MIKELDTIINSSERTELEKDLAETLKLSINYIKDMKNDYKV